jgi:hypothetical protein
MNPEDILLSGGEPIGTPSHGGDETIRNIPGGPKAAREIYDRLSRGGTAYHGNYPGTGVELPNGGFIGIRGADTAHPTIDVNIPGLAKVSKLHF